MIPGTVPLTLSQFNGAWVPSAQLQDSTQVPLTYGIQGRNTRYFGNNVAKRYGFATLFSPGDAVTALINWLFLHTNAPANYAAWFVPGVGVKIADLSNPVPSTPISQATAVTASLQPLGSRLYCGFMDANGIGVAPGQVFGFGVGADPLFAPPIVTAPTFSETGGPFTTAGQKNIGYVIQTRNGYITKPCPAPSNTFIPVSFTSTGGLIHVVVDPPGHNWPDYAQSIAPIMTTTANPNAYFIVPGPAIGTPPWYGVNRSNQTNMIIACTDDYLTSAGQDATPYFNQLSQSVTGTSPIDPCVIFAYGQRMAYITIDSAGVPVCYFSDSSAPQSINAASSGVYLPGNLQQVTGFALAGVAYLLGPNWTFSTTDNNGVPSTWAQPQQVSGSHGAGGPFCVPPISAEQTYTWVANQSGLYNFAGSFPDRPISYWQTGDWKRINFSARTKIFVTDDATNKVVVVLAPLDGATSPTHKLTWDYSLGTSPEQAQYSLWNVDDYQAGAMAVMQNATTLRQELCIAPSNGAYPIGRQMDALDTAPYRDFASAINSLFETSPLPRGMAGCLIMHHGANLRVRGQGLLRLTVWALDHGNSVGPFTIGLSIGAGSEFLQRFFLNNEYATLQFESSDIDSWFQLSRVDHFYNKGVPHR